MADVMYTCFALPPDGIKAQKYSFDKDDKGYFVSDTNSKTYMELSEIKMMFTPIDNTWEDVLKVQKTENTEKIEKTDKPNKAATSFKRGK